MTNKPDMNELKEEVQDIKDALQSPPSDLEKLPEGTLDDIVQRREAEHELVFEYDSKRHMITYKLLGWITNNSIVAEMSRKYQGATATEYERGKQERMMKLMVKSVDGQTVDQAWWATAPFDFPETVRFAMFGSNGEMAQANDMLKNLVGKSSKFSNTSDSGSQMPSVD